MAIILNGTTHHLRSNSFGASRPAAYSIATWWRGDAAPSTGAVQTILSVGNTLAFPNDRGDIFISWGHTSASARNVPTIHTAAGGYTNSNTAGSASSGVWLHRVATFADTRLKFFENGAQVGTTVSATVTAPAPADWIVFVGGADGGTSSRAPGRVCMIGYWDVELTDDEAAALGKGVAPHHIRPQSLRYFVPGLRDANAAFGATNTASNLTYTDDNPRIYM